MTETLEVSPKNSAAGPNTDVAPANDQSSSERASGALPAVTSVTTDSICRSGTVTTAARPSATMPTQPGGASREPGCTMTRLRPSRNAPAVSVSSLQAFRATSIDDRATRTDCPLESAYAAGEHRRAAV